MTESAKDQKPSPSALGNFREIYGLYENGKGRRYNLLFAVNGGALAILKGIGDAATTAIAAKTTDASSTIAMDLRGEAAFSFTAASIGMMLFVLIMTVDIWMFGQRIREEALKFGIEGAPVPFGEVGKAVLLLNAALLIGAWHFAASL